MPKYKITTEKGTYIIETADAPAPDKGTVITDQARAAFAANPNPLGISDNRTTGQVAKDSALNNLEGIGQFVAGIPGMVKDTGVMLSEALNPMASAGRVNRGMQAGQAVKQTLGPLANDAQILRTAAEGGLINSLFGRPTIGTTPGTPSTPEQQRGYQNFAGQNLGALLVSEAVPPAAKFAMNPRASLIEALNAQTTPDALLASAGRLRTAIAERPSLRIPTSVRSALLDSENLLSRATMKGPRASIMESLADFMANGKPYGPNRNVPTFTEPNLESLRRMPSQDTYALRDSLERQRQANISEVEARSRMAPNQINQAVPTGEATADQAVIPQKKLNIPRPPREPGLARAIEEYQTPPPLVLDGPSVNKWMGTKANDLVRGADPGKYILDNELIGADKAATLQKVIPALQSSEEKLGLLLKAADEKGITLDAKSTFDNAIADAVKPFAEGTDEAFQKKLDQITTDANAQVEDLSKIKPTENHMLKKMIGDQIDWNAKETTPYQKVLKRIYSGLNNQLGDVDAGIRSTQLDWQNLNMATKNLQGSMRSNLVGRGTAADPLAEALKNRGRK